MLFCKIIIRCGIRKSLTRELCFLATEALGDGYGIAGMHQPCPVCGVPYSYSRQSERRHPWCRDTPDPE